MDRMDYRDFELHIERYGEQYKAHVLNSPAGQASSVFSVPFTADRIESLITRLGHVRHGTRGGRSLPIKLAGHTAPITGMVLSPDGQILASASQDKTARLWGLHGLS